MNRFGGIAIAASLALSQRALANEAPTVDSVALAPLPPTASAALRCEVVGAKDAEGDPLGMLVVWTVDGRRVRGAYETTLPAGTLRRGQSVACSVAPSDGVRVGTVVQSPPATVANTPPTVASASIAPESPASGDALTCAPGALADADGDPVDARIAWFVNGTAIEATGATLSAEATRKGDRVRCAITPSDGVSDGTAAQSAEVTVRNTPPTVAGVSLEPAEPVAGAPVRCVAGAAADADGEEVKLAYAWEISGRKAGGTSDTLAASFVKKGARIACTVTPSDASGPGTPVSTPAVSTGNTAPTLSGAEIVPGDATSQDALTCRPVGAADADGDPISHTYAWSVGGKAVADAGATLEAARTKRGDAVTCTITASDGSKSSAPVTSAPLTVANAPPTVQGASIAPEAPAIADTLTCTASGLADPDGDDVQVRTAWTVDGAAVAQAGSTLPPGAFAKGQKVACTVTPFDGTSEGRPVSSPPLLVGNSPPKLASARIAPEAPLTADALSCEPGEATDADGDRIAFRTAWTVDGKPLPDTTSTLPAAKTARGKSFACTLTPFDGALAGAPVTAAPVVVGNTPPSVAGARIEQKTPTSRDALTCVPGKGTDPDGDAVALVLSWTADGRPVGGDDRTLPAGSVRKGQSVVCTVKPSDGTAEGTPAASEPVTIRNSPPKATGLTVTPTDPHTNARLTAAASGEDLDGDPISWEYAWTVGGKPAGTGASLDGATAFRKGDVVKVVATPSDGTDAGARIASDPLTVRNTPPTTPTVDLGDPKAGDQDLVCAVTAESSDADEDRIAYRFEWTLDGAPFTGATATTHPMDTAPKRALAIDQTWTCRASASDGTAQSEWSAVTDAVVVPRQIGSGTSHACALRTDGRLFCWGNADYGNTEPPKGHFRRLSVGGWHSCGIRFDGRLECWGHNIHKQSKAPEGRFLQVSAGAWHTCAIDASRALACWGQEADGRTAAPGGSFAQVSAGWTNTCAVRTDGRVQCWGGDEKGQSQAPTGTGFTQVSAGEYHACAIDASGSITCWGADSSGETKAPPGPWAEVHAGSRFTCARAADGRASCWGLDNYDQTGIPDRTWSILGHGFTSACGFTAEGKPLCWGQDNYGQVSRIPAIGE